jgi:hypothetical protein
MKKFIETIISFVKITVVLLFFKKIYGCFVRTKLTWENLGSLQNPGKMGYVERYYIWGTVRFII